MKRIFSYSLIFTFVFSGLVSCPPPADTPAGQEGNSLIIDLSDELAIDEIPANDIDTTVSAYTLTGMGPNGAEFTLETSGRSAKVNNLAAGNWVVTAEARNRDGVILNKGRQETHIHESQRIHMHIPMNCIRKYGTLELTVLWDAADVKDPRINGALIPLWGMFRYIRFGITEPGTAFSRKTRIPAGFYLLMVILKDNRRYIKGSIEMVRIKENTVAVKTLDFRKKVNDTGTIEVNITPQMNDPLVLGLDGQVENIAQGQEMTVSAFLTEPEGNTVFTWYINGVGTGIGRSVSLGESLVPGIYRLDVTAFSADGLRGGSTSWIFHVVPN
jgi:hypothetical protein